MWPLLHRESKSIFCINWWNASLQQFCTTPPNILSGGILVGWPFKIVILVGSIPTVAIPNPDQQPSRFFWLNWFAVPKGNLLVHLQDIWWNIFNNDKSESEVGLWCDEKSKIKISKWMGSMPTVIGAIPTFEHHRWTMHFWKKEQKMFNFELLFLQDFHQKIVKFCTKLP